MRGDPTRFVARENDDAGYRMLLRVVGKFDDSQPRDEHGRWAVMFGRQGEETQFELGRTRRYGEALQELEDAVASQVSHHEGHAEPGDRVVTGRVGHGVTGISVTGEQKDFVDLFWVEPVDPRTFKAARTLRLASGGRRRENAINPIIARVRAELVALAAEHGNRPDEEPT